MKWKDSISTRVPLKNEVSYPIKTAKYSTKNGIDKESTPQCWIPYVIKKQRNIILRIRARYMEVTHKYGMKVPQINYKACTFDKENNNDLWR